MVVEAIPGMPVVDDVLAPALERRAVRKGYVRRVARAAHDGATLRFRTEDRLSTRFTDWGGAEHRDASSDAGELRFDLLADEVVRVRYVPGGSATDVPSPILVGDLGGPSSHEVDEHDDHTMLTTPAMAVRVDHDPLLVTITDHGGREIARIGGREKNGWGIWDTFSTGVSRTVDGDLPLATECYALRPGEAVYGFGEQFGPLDKVGQTLDLVMEEATGTTTRRAYKNIPFFWTTCG